jgi:hypothetical protein
MALIDNKNTWLIKLAVQNYVFFSRYANKNRFWGEFYLETYKSTMLER